MGCVYHPQRTATAVCEQCSAELCDSCTIRLEDGRILCHRCIVALSLYDVRAERARRRLRQEARRLGLEKRWRPGYLQVLLFLAALLLAGLIGLRLHWSRPAPPRPVILNPERPMSLLGNLQSALEYYALTHRGTYPESLYDLFPTFLTDNDQNRRVLHYLDYHREASEGYRLRIKENSHIPGKELLVTATGIRPALIKPPGRPR